MSLALRGLESDDEEVQTTKKGRLLSPSPDIVEGGCSSFEEEGASQEEEGTSQEEEGALQEEEGALQEEEVAFQEEKDLRLSRMISPDPLRAPLPVEEKKDKQKPKDIVLITPRPSLKESMLQNAMKKVFQEEEKDWRLLQIIPPDPWFAPSKLEQKKDKQKETFILDTSPVSSYEIKDFLKPRLNWPESGITYVSSGRGTLDFKERSQLESGTLSRVEAMCPSCVQAESKWANLLLKKIVSSKNDPKIILLDLTSAQPEVFETLLAKGPAGVSAIKDFMKDLSQKDVKINYREIDGHGFTKSYVIISAATALALAIRLKCKDDILFSRLVVYSPSKVIKQIAIHHPGALVTDDFITIALKCVMETLLAKFSERNYEISKDPLLEAAANLVSTFLEHHAHQGKESLQSAIRLLISKIKPDANEKTEIIVAAIVTGTIVAGTIKQAIEIATTETKLPDDIEEGVDMTLSVLACCDTFDLDRVNSLATFIVDICINKVFKLKYEALVISIEDFVTDAVYWPLIDEYAVPLSTSEWKDKLAAKDIVDFKSCFDLVMRSNYLTVDVEDNVDAFQDEEEDWRML